MNQPEFFARNRKMMYAVAILNILVIGWLDWFTGREISLFVFYSVPIFLVVWYGDRGSGLVTAFVSAFVWWWANRNDNLFTTSYGYPLATASRLACFILFAFGAAGLKSRREADRARIDALERARNALERAHKMEREIVGIGEREQRRIGQDLHDGLCQTLAAIGCAATSLTNDLKQTSPLQAASAQDIADLLNEAAAEARDLARGICPLDMAEHGLAAALNDLAERTSRLTPLSVSFELMGDIRMVDTEAAINLYRIAQEATHNAVRHSQANCVEIALTHQGAQFTLSVTDDGVGVAKQSSSKGGMGMQTMGYRAQMIGAELNITANSPSGTCVSCSLKANSDPTIFPAAPL
jgi:signal transduction histidine kinase